MQKAISIVITFIFVLGTSNITLSQHYCMGDFSGVELYTGKVENCGVKLDTAESSAQYTILTKNCCKTVLHFIEVSGQSQMTSFHYNFRSPLSGMAVMPNLSTVEISSFTKTLHKRPTNYALPPPDGPLYKRHQVYII